MRFSFLLLLWVAWIAAPALHADGLPKPLAELDPIASLERPEAVSISQLTTQARLLHERLTELRTLKRDAIKDVQAELIEASLVASTLSKPPLNDKQIEKLREQIKARPSTAERYEAQLEAGMIQDAERRAELKTQAEERKNRAAVKLSEISRPYDEANDAMRERARALNDILHDRLQPLFLTETAGPLAAESFRLTVRLESGYVGASWRSENKTVASASLRLEAGEPDLTQMPDKLDDRFPMMLHSERSMQVHVGDFLVRMHLTRQDQGNDGVTVQEAVKRLIDLEELEKIDAAAGQTQMS